MLGLLSDLLVCYEAMSVRVGLFQARGEECDLSEEFKSFHPVVGRQQVIANGYCAVASEQSQIVSFYHSADRLRKSHCSRLKIGHSADRAVEYSGFRQEIVVEFLA